MSPEQEDLVRWLACVPGGRHPLDRPGFARRTGIEDPCRWALDELSAALTVRDAATAELALMVGEAFGVDRRWTAALIDLVDGDWHQLHVAAVVALGALRTPDAVPALFGATRWVPGYLASDDDRTLALRAVEALSAIPGDEATAALEELLRHEDDAVVTCAGRELDRRLT